MNCFKTRTELWGRRERKRFHFQVDIIIIIIKRLASTRDTIRFNELHYKFRMIFVKLNFNKEKTLKRAQRIFIAR